MAAKNRWIKAKMAHQVEDGTSQIVHEKRHVGLVNPDSAGAISAPEKHVGVRVESRAERRYGKRK